MTIRWVWGHVHPDFFFNKFSEINSEAICGYYFSVLKGKYTQADSVIFGLRRKGGLGGGGMFLLLCVHAIPW